MRGGEEATGAGEVAPRDWTSGFENTSAYLGIAVRVGISKQEALVAARYECHLSLGEGCNQKLNLGGGTGGMHGAPGRVQWMQYEYNSPFNMQYCHERTGICRTSPVLPRRFSLSSPSQAGRPGFWLKTQAAALANPLISLACHPCV